MPQRMTVIRLWQASHDCSRQFPRPGIGSKRCLTMELPTIKHSKKESKKNSASAWSVHKIQEDGNRSQRIYRAASQKLLPTAYLCAWRGSPLISRGSGKIRKSSSSGLHSLWMNTTPVLTANTKPSAVQTPGPGGISPCPMIDFLLSILKTRPLRSAIKGCSQNAPQLKGS